MQSREFNVAKALFVAATMFAVSFASSTAVAKSKAKATDSNATVQKSDRADERSSSDSRGVLAQSRESAYPEPIAKMVARGKGVVVLDNFKVDGTELTAWIVKSGAERRIFYVPASGAVAILGLVFDKDLNNVTTEHALRYTSPAAIAAGSGPATAPATAMEGFETGPLMQVAFSQLVNARASHVEGGGKDVYVVYDPGCPSCHNLWKASRGLLGQLRIHWVPIASVTQKSANLAENILTAMEPEKAFAAAAVKRLAPADSVSPAVASVLSRNATILQAAGKKNVPFIVFDRSGKAYGHVGWLSESGLRAIASH